MSWYMSSYVQISFNIIYIMRTNIESDRIRRFMGIVDLVADGP